MKIQMNTMSSDNKILSFFIFYFIYYFIYLFIFLSKAPRAEVKTFLQLSFTKAILSAEELLLLIKWLRKHLSLLCQTSFIWFKMKIFSCNVQDGCTTLSSMHIWNKVQQVLCVFQKQLQYMNHGWNMPSDNLNDYTCLDL